MFHQGTGAWMYVTYPPPAEGASFWPHLIHREPPMVAYTTLLSMQRNAFFHSSLTMKLMDMKST
jgi:hypothetical protein